MVLPVQDLPLVAERVAQLAIHVELVLEPQRPGLEERRKPTGRDAQVGLENALELEERLVVEADIVQVGNGDSAGLETVLHGVRGKGGVPLLASESLFLGGSDDLAVAQQARRAIV